MRLFKKHVPEVLQIEAVECGAASLCMILGYYGRYVDLSLMRRECHVSRDGTKLKYLIAAAEKYGLKARALRFPFWSDFVGLPAIIFWKYYHFLVVEEVTEKYALICDPAIGRKKIPREEFNKYYSGVVLELTPKEDFEKGGIPFSMALTKNILGAVKKQWSAFGYLAIVTVLLNFVGIMLPGMTGLFVDVYLPAMGYANTSVYFAVFSVLTAFQLLLLLVQKNATIHFQKSRAASMNSNLMSKLFSLPLGYFQTRSHYAMVSRLCSVDTLATFLSVKLVPIILGLLFSVIYFAVLMHYSMLIGTVILVVISSVLALMFWIMSETKAAALNVSSLGNAFAGCLGQCINLFDTIKSTAMERQMSENIMGSYIAYTNATQESKEWQSLLQAIPVAMPVLIQAVTVIVGCYMLIDRKMSVGNIMACQSIAMAIYFPLAQFLGEYSSFQTQSSNIRGLRDIMDEQEDILATRVAKEQRGNFDSIELKNVTFGYNVALPPVVKDINFKVEAGKSIAIVGTSGSGKTTVLRLVEGLFVPQEGEVLFNGIKIEDTDRKKLCDSISIVSQEPELFNGTVRDNITLFDRTITAEAVEKAARGAEILSVVQSKKDGFNEQIDTACNSFSGGEVQRLMIARALVRNPRILIMDEATSALDAIVEERIMQNISSRGITRVIVAHRLSTIRDADEIVVLDKGVIAERGTHAQLLAKEDSLYSKLVLSERECKA